MPGDPRFRAVLDEAWSLHCRKTADYGNDEDFYANVRASEDWANPAWVGSLVRAGDKMKRLQKFAATGELTNEGALDSTIDLVVYSVIAHLLLEEELSERIEV